jgi:hypothetical protein
MKTPLALLVFGAFGIVASLACGYDATAIELPSQPQAFQAAYVTNHQDVAAR